MIRRRTLPLVVVAVGCLSVLTLAQQPERARALDEQIGRIFQSPDYQAPRFGPARWLPDGAAYTIVERSSEPKRSSTSIAR